MSLRLSDSILGPLWYAIATQSDGGGLGPPKKLPRLRVLPAKIPSLELEGGLQLALQSVVLQGFKPGGEASVELQETLSGSIFQRLE